MEWFFGFKLHLIINEKSEILNLMITSGNVDDRVPLKYENFAKEIYGKFVGDKSYTSQNLFENWLLMEKLLFQLFTDYSEDTVELCRTYNALIIFFGGGMFADIPC